MQKGLIAASVITLLVHFAVTAYYRPALPAKIAGHYGFSGNPDSWRGKGSIWALPIISLTQCLIFIPLSLIPRSYNYPIRITPENAAKIYSLGRSLILAINFEITVLFFYITWATIRVALDQATGLGPQFIFVFLGILFGTIGAFFYLARKYK